jgi:hypothetical protein
MLPIDPAMIETQLRTACSVEVRFEPPKAADFNLTGEAIAQYFHRLMSDVASFERVMALTRDGTRFIVEADKQFFDEEMRMAVRRIEATMREWAPKYASLRAHETNPIVLAFPTFFRPYNDTLTKLVRCLVDNASAIAARLADEEAEDAEAAEWAARHPSLGADDEDEIPLEDVSSRLYPGEYGAH